MRKTRNLPSFCAVGRVARIYCRQIGLPANSSPIQAVCRGLNHETRVVKREVLFNEVETKR
jgi:hypothetical protein